ncbi:DUF4907 domain-containing protein [Carboxylicivirga sp. RSCT41]|uniref:DUF4907 domain-containing protein n=1 Tax=Carboxylicivirga agarovorans TaxID=3417570 RepID=UPI003D32AF1C
MMTIKGSFAPFLKWGSIVLIMACCLVYYLEKPVSGYSYKVIEVDKGYGYQILNNKKVLIQQDFIPTINGYQPFVTEEQAGKAAMMMIEKLQARKRPTLSEQEIQQLME